MGKRELDQVDDDDMTPDFLPSHMVDTEATGLKLAIIEALRQIYDPEIPVDIYQLGLIYTIEIGDDGQANIDMTLTSPMCPVAGSLPIEVEQRVLAVEGIRQVVVRLVWEPPWSPELMSEAAQLELGFF